MLTTPLHWVGGKKHLLPTLVPRMESLLAAGAPYYEGFLGGGSVLTRALSTNCRRFVVSEAEPAVLYLWRSLLRGDDVADAWLRLCVEYPPATHYYRLREDFNAGFLTGDRFAAATIYISRFGFNGLWRRNGSGGINVPAGSAVKTGKVDTIVATVYERLVAWRAEFQDRVVDVGFHVDYADMLPRMSRDGRPLVGYFDPPYHKTFNGYTPAGAFDTEALLRNLEAIDVTDGSLVILSNSLDAEPLLSPGKWRVEYVSRSGSVSCKADGRQRVGEILATRIP